MENGNDQHVALPPKTLAGLLLCRIVIICLFGVIGVVLIALYAPKDSATQSIATLVGLVTLIVGQLINLAKTKESAYSLGAKVDLAADQATVAASKAQQVAETTNQIAALTIETAKSVQQLKTNGV